MERLLYPFKLFTTAVLIMMTCFVYAQDGQSESEANPSYTYISDKRYNVIHELEDEQFFPAGYQLEQSTPEEIAPGQITVSLYSQKVWVQGVEGLETFHVVSKQADRVGFVYELMDKDGGPARFKVVTDQNRYVNLLYLYSKTLGEHTFFLAEKDESELAADKSYYTAQEQFFVRSFRNLVDKTIKPYSMMTSMMQSSQPAKIEQAQNVNFEFSEESITTPQGTYSIKEANTFEYKLAGFPGVRSMIEVTLKGTKEKMFIFLNYKQQIEVIEIGETRYFLMK